MTIQLQPFDPRTAPDELIAAYNACRNQLRAETLPDDPPVPFEETLQSFRHIPDFVQIQASVAMDGEVMVGYAFLQYSLKDNLHLAQFALEVLPDYRQQGIGKMLLAKVIETAQQQERPVLITETSARVPAGAIFATKIGGHKGLEAHTNQLTLAELDHNLVNEWCQLGETRAAGFEIDHWDGPYPDDTIDAVVELYDLFNQQPFGDLDVEGTTFTVKKLRDIEKNIFARGMQRWTVTVKEKETGAFAGFTEVMWHPNRPDVIEQGITGVFPQFRGNGLGRWLKAAMMAKIVADRPEAKFVRTDNADSNAPMMKINNAMGFKPYKAEALWQFETEKAAEYLAAA